MKQDKIRACLLGGAAGDALGYAVEFDSEQAIRSRYGLTGIFSYDLRHGKALISDDTQMTLFTAEALISDPQEIKRQNMDAQVQDIFHSYKDWLYTQEHPFNPNYSGSSDLMKEDFLFAHRAPGMTCMSALSSDHPGTVETPINNSKGCGGIMRTAPVALALSGTWDPDQSSLLAAKAAAITHGHPLGWLSSAALNYLLVYLMEEDLSIEEAALKTISSMELKYGHNPYTKELTDLMQQAIDLSHSNCSDLEAIHQLGEGWVAEETLAIALLCALRHPDDLYGAIIAAVNHKGDSDSTGAVAGQIVGAHTGSFPDVLLKNLEGTDVLEAMAQKLSVLNPD